MAAETWTINSATLIGIADALRTQLGTDAQIAVVDIADKILDIGAGATPSTTGGVETGEFTPMSNTSTFDIDTDLSTVNGVLIIRADSSSWANQEPALMICVNDGGSSGSTNYYGVSVRCNWGNQGTSYSTSCPLTIDDGIITLDGTSTSWYSSHTFVKAKTYKYIIF